LVDRGRAPLKDLRGSALDGSAYARSSAQKVKVDEKLQREIEALGCSPAESKRLLELIAKETAALVA
jgi:hypothetical protein